MEARKIFKTISTICMVIGGLLIIYPYIPFFFTELTYSQMVLQYGWNWVGGIVFSLLSICIEVNDG